MEYWEWTSSEDTNAYLRSEVIRQVNFQCEFEVVLVPKKILPNGVYIAKSSAISHNYQYNQQGPCH